MSSALFIISAEGPLPSVGTSVMDIVKWSQHNTDKSEFGVCVWDNTAECDICYVHTYEVPAISYNAFITSIHNIRVDGNKGHNVVPTNVMIDLWVDGSTLYIYHKRLGIFDTKEEWAQYCNKTKFVVDV